MINSIHRSVEQFLQHRTAVLHSNGAIIGGAIILFVLGCKVKIFNSSFVCIQITVAYTTTIKTNCCSDSGIATLQKFVEQIYSISSHEARFGSGVAICIALFQSTLVMFFRQ